MKSSLYISDSAKATPKGGGLVEALLHLADNALILGQRNAEWCGHGPVLEQDIAITNISLDLIGQARNFYQYAAALINDTTSSSPSARGLRGEDEDTLAYLRTERDFKNCLLVELPRGDWAHTILRQFFFSNYQFLLFEKLKDSNDEQIAAIAAKSLKEVAYHLRWSSEWVIRLGDGTEESHQRMLNAIDLLWSYTGELFMPADYEMLAYTQGLGTDCSLLKEEWMQKTTNIFNEAGLSVPGAVFMHTGGKTGLHTEHMGYILSDLQYLQRTYPNAKW